MSGHFSFNANTKQIHYGGVALIRLISILTCSSGKENVEISRTRELSLLCVFAARRRSLFKFSLDALSLLIYLARSQVFARGEICEVLDSSARCYSRFNRSRLYMRVCVCVRFERWKYYLSVVTWICENFVMCVSKCMCKATKLKMIFV